MMRQVVLTSLLVMVLCGWLSSERGGVRSVLVVGVKEGGLVGFGAEGGSVVVRGVDV